MSSRYYKKELNGHTLSPETLMMSYGYDPELSEGAIKPPVFLTSTFVFKTAQEGKDFFNMVSGRTPTPDNQKQGLVYSRFNHPNSEIVEDRLALYEGAESAALFSSGMSAITTCLLAFLKPGDVLLHSQPLYGGTETLFLNTLARFGITPVAFQNGCDAKSIREVINGIDPEKRIAAIYIETPSNPLNTLVGIHLLSEIAQEIAQTRQSEKPLLICDNTLLGPIFQKPLALGADLSVYSLTKYVGGHSDLVAGGVVGRRELLDKVRAQRNAIGTQLDPHSSWMIGRSLETLQLRMEKANDNAQQLATFLHQHPNVKKVHYPAFLAEESAEYQVYSAQCSGAGSTFSINVGDNEEDAFNFLNHLALFKLAVSLGGTESLACHPASTTHSGIAESVRRSIGIESNLVRLSVGIENVNDLKEALSQALEAI
ncbi:cystathionine gamma-synthase family protein [Providencia vermicola]|uniref:Cystathionine gamma-synthase family protein n=1 Tax=Providencia vermicola TaxID=333965 RepID=A0AAX3RXS6_9GAMM|nr:MULTISPECIES: cystathionine gamma-synthase family protein [Providencia]ELX8379228.1 cystathionine gamma-synthase family protein [Providencia stuartii]EMD5258432.1 cystathionine gamma-synthase family protein [Providencia stuartii]USB38525.1 cystathionine gamma-synthase family protein [Providencia vermicola]WFC07462.1 cystathionine gamma-synthase family protein [Providencia vermicola]